METTFVISHFSDIRKEMTLFLVVPKKIDQEQRSFNVGSDNYNKQETTIIRPYFGDPKVVSTISVCNNAECKIFDAKSKIFGQSDYYSTFFWKLEFLQITRNFRVNVKPVKFCNK